MTSGFTTGLQAADVTPGTVITVVVQGVPLCVGQTLDGRWGAIDDVCTHDEGDLGDGELDGTAVEPAAIPLVDDGAVHQVRIVIGKRQV